MGIGQQKLSTKIVGKVKSVTKTEKEYLIAYETGEQAKLNILNNHVFKYFMSPTGEFPDYPEPMNPDDVAKITAKKISDYDTTAFEKSHVKEHEHSFIIHTIKIHIEFDKIKGTMSVFDKRTNKQVFSEAKPLSYANNKATQKLHQLKDEYFFGGGMQNGRFSHKGEVIHIVNTNKWTDGGVTSPCPFYWSTNGYGVMRHTWQPGRYDFGLHKPDFVKTIHKGEDFDAFYFINEQPKRILTDYFELTGKPLLMPEYAFYEAHLNAFNRDYWVKVSSDTPGAILFEDGEYYKSYKPNEMGDKTGILESLNGEKNNYQFSARAMVDRYRKHDVPLGWFIPNDGYGSGYGQTDSLAGDIENLKEFANYARKNGVEVALWTESQLEPKDPENPKKGERDLAKEVGVAGVVALKCDVAWIGSGYSFGLNAVENATNIFMKTTEHRPMIIMVDGWAGTQRYSGIWSGDQSGGEWEYIRFHIPTYIGTGLSGQPVLGSDMDGIYRGKSREVNIRDFQWKTFTPLQLNMDGWGSIPKTPFSFGDEATAINRAYLKLKSTMMPYNYSIGHESINGLPMIRGMFLEFPSEPSAYTLDSQYQYMWGPSILVAPIYKQRGVMDASIRDGILLPDADQVWIDFFTGEKYQGGKILNNIRVPLWKLPVFLKDGAIIPMVNPNNNPYEIQRDNRIFTIYPNGETIFHVYEDDGISVDYLKGHSASTTIKVVGPKSNESGELLVNIHKTKGSYKSMVKERTTLLRIMASKDIQRIKAAANGEPLQLSRVDTDEDFYNKENVYYFKEDFIVNPYLKEVTEEIWKQKFLLVKLSKVDITENEIHLKVKGYTNKGKIFGSNTSLNESLEAPSHLTALTVRTSIALLWEPVNEATYYEIERDGAVFSNITGSSFTFEDFKYESKHTFRIRSVNDEGVSEWSDFVDAVEIEDPYRYTVKDVKASCSVPCEPGEAICKLTDGDLKSLWHTQWDMPHQADYKTGSTIKVNFDLGSVYEIEKFEYYPRADGGNGTILKIQYRHSIDGQNWSQFSEAIDWKRDDKVKKVAINGVKMRYVEWNILDAVGGFAAGRQVMFYRTSTFVPTKIDDRNKNIVQGVKATCTLPCESGQNICKLTDGDTASLCMWHTKWDELGRIDPEEGQHLAVHFDLGDVFEIEKMEYYPRDDAGNGTFLEVEYRHSIDGEAWTALSDTIHWSHDEIVKTIPLGGAKFRYIELHVLNTIGNYGSGRQILFYKKNN
ncbi:uncharacterized protein LOC126377489 [Pectinophora gossypiella]|uniref:uncharacterized protein LOC126377489 n=1 Tax=Pectinophora gossypiella TaxID=13191 RepID=UPI00214EE336|nr:uncharacterized protein LOC126377489 [Pectinophora gossypiella]XP_049881177.1 uncharacterized protein LOC126377489 [Pectinophora gossypiella]